MSDEKNVMFSKGHLWREYFEIALSGLVNTPVVAEWNPVVLVQKASDIADEAIKTVAKKAP